MKSFKPSKNTFSKEPPAKTCLKKNYPNSTPSTPKPIIPLHSTISPTEYKIARIKITRMKIIYRKITGMKTTKKKTTKKKIMKEIFRRYIARRKDTRKSLITRKITNKKNQTKDKISSANPQNELTKSNSST
jgi:hypothetical protein